MAATSGRRSGAAPGGFARPMGSLHRWPWPEGATWQVIVWVRSHMGISWNGGTSIAGWLRGENPNLKMDENWGTSISGNPHMIVTVKNLLVTATYGQ